jgi:hypothetical protein
MDSFPADTSPSGPLVLTNDQMHQLAAARDACLPVSRAVRVASMSGWTMVVFAGLTLIAGLSMVSAIWMGLAMTITAMVELRACRRLRRLDPSATSTLAYNQLVLAFLIVLYALWKVDGVISAAPAVAKVSINIDGPASRFLQGNPIFLRDAQLFGYVAMAGIALLTQGTTAWYYFSRNKWLKQYVSSTPEWILQIQRAGVSF